MQAPHENKINVEGTEPYFSSPLLSVRRPSCTAKIQLEINLLQLPKQAKLVCIKIHVECA